MCVLRCEVNGLSASPFILYFQWQFELQEQMYIVFEGIHLLVTTALDGSVWSDSYYDIISLGTSCRGADKPL